MENLSCQDILRHCSPFRQGICQSSTALWECWNTAMMPPVVQPEAPWAPLSVLAFSPSVWDDLLTVKGQRPSVFVPVLSPAMWAPSTPLCSQLCDPSRCPLPFSIRVVNALGPTVWACCCRGLLLTVCSQRRAFVPGVGWWRPPGTLPPSHCPPTHSKQKSV